jgi:hypothetical protein
MLFQKKIPPLPVSLAIMPAVNLPVVDIQARFLCFWENASLSFGIPLKSEPAAGASIKQTKKSKLLTLL